MDKTIIFHDEQVGKRGYYSKIMNREIITGEAFTIWEQVIPPGGYIVPHYHEFEETLTFLNGRVQVTINDEQFQIEADTTVYIQPYLIHSVSNMSDETVRLLAVLMTADPNVIYPDGSPEPVKWEAD